MMFVRKDSNSESLHFLNVLLPEVLVDLPETFVVVFNQTIYHTGFVLFRHRRQDFISRAHPQRMRLFQRINEVVPLETESL